MVSKRRMLTSLRLLNQSLCLPHHRVNHPLSPFPPLLAERCPRSQLRSGDHGVGLACQAMDTKPPEANCLNTPHPNLHKALKIFQLDTTSMAEKGLPDDLQQVHLDRPTRDELLLHLIHSPGLSLPLHGQVLPNVSQPSLIPLTGRIRRTRPKDLHRPLPHNPQYRDKDISTPVPR